MYELCVARREYFPSPSVRPGRPDIPWLPFLTGLASTHECGEAVAGYPRQSSLPTVVLNDPCFFFNPAHRVPTDQYKCSCQTLISKSFHTGKLRALNWNSHSPLPTAGGSLLMTCAARGATRYKVAKVSTHVCYFSISQTIEKLWLGQPYPHVQSECKVKVHIRGHRIFGYV
ncbi:hypothetical protein PISMIDRAFT_681946 [Pisolithus microcarpus 441]|uniref:Uncharacterized protein n=1 Tax=Pisolithus microcarpus 441 TaxID=765257 RepID=A0A0C9Y7V1_9AGAM|nr:hypothetical protein PISMIDRAFT_681946 [Pisolithus microcarpus 441]